MGSGGRRNQVSGEHSRVAKQWALAFFFGLLLLNLHPPLSHGYTQNIMLTGYWDPTGQMLQKFSQDPDLNPSGWQGDNWMGLGYDIYAYFPDPNKGYTGDFEVDYQDTWDDFWRITGEIDPVAILSYGRG
jgi:hypothetical protein